jgi:hypothetical protein
MNDREYKYEFMGCIRRTAGSLGIGKVLVGAPEPSFPYQALTESGLSFDYVAYPMEQVAVRVSSKQSGKSEQNVVTRAASTFQTRENDREKEV